MPNIDERLMAAQYQDRLRQERLADEDKKRQEQLGEADQDRQGAGGEAGGQSGSFRDRWRAAKQAMNLKQKAKDKIAEKVTTPARAGTSRALQWAWKALIPSWGLSSIWLNIHVFLRMVFGEKLFCKLGEEWIPKPLAGAGGEAGKGLSKSIGIIEVMGLLFLDLVAFIIILTALGLVVMIMGWIKHPLDAIAQLGWGAISVLKSLFSMLL